MLFPTDSPNMTWQSRMWLLLPPSGDPNGPSALKKDPSLCSDPKCITLILFLPAITATCQHGAPTFQKRLVYI